MDILVNDAALRPANDDLIILWGMMGAGKSSKGRLIAKSLGWEFQDLDRWIARAENRSVAEIFASDGEDYFRKIEGEALSDWLDKRSGAAVLAVGGGTPVHPSLRAQMLKSGWCVLLDADASVLSSRLFEGRAERPLIADVDSKPALEKRLNQLLTERQSAYEEAHLKVSAFSIQPAALAQQLMRIIQE